MIDNIFLEIFLFLRNYPSILISLINFIICIPTVFILKKYFGYAGLCCYMALSSIIANIQVLYATSYEVINTEVLLGTVIFCSSFLACDLININYGPEKAKKAVYLTIITDMFLLLNMTLTLGHKPLNYCEFPNFGIPNEIIKKNIESIQQLFIPTPRLLIASYITYLIAQISQIKLFNLMKRINFIKLDYIKHNISLFISSIIIDTAVFSFLGLYLLSDTPINMKDFLEICLSAIIIRTLCNIGNTFAIKYC